MSAHGPRWVPAMYLCRSPLDDLTWVPYDSLDTPDSLSVHAGPLKAVQVYAEGYLRREYEAGGFGEPTMRWVERDENKYALEVRE